MADEDGDALLTLDEVKDLLKSLHLVRNLKIYKVYSYFRGLMISL